MNEDANKSQTAPRSRKPALRRDDIVYPELSYEIIGCAFEVFDTLGPGHSEKIYQKAMAVAFRKRNILFKEQLYYALRFMDEIVGKGFLDFEIDSKIVVELKKGGYFSKTNLEQVLDYLKKSKLKLGILINFSQEGVKYKRILNINQSPS